jgi:hypothetical protein
MAIDFGRAARGIATGYISEVIRDRRQADQEKYENLQYAKRQYFEVDKPAFMKQEETRENNYNLISSTLTPVYGNYADAIGATANDASTRLFLKQIKDLSNEDQYRIESTFIDRKKGRVKSFDERTSEVRDFISNLPGGPGSTNLTNLFFPKEGEDPAEVGIGQGQATETTDTQTAAASDIPMMPMKSIMQIEGGSGNNYDVNNARHASTASKADSTFNTNFFDTNTRTYNFNVGEESDLADDVKFLRKGFDEVKANDYPFGFATYAREKYIKSILEAQGIDNYPTTYDAYVTPQKTTDAPQADQNQVQTKAKANDGTKFDVSQIGPKENIGINIQSKRAKEGGGFGSASSLLDGLRNTISKINQSSVDDDEKEKLANDARQFVREELKKLGLNPDDFTL